MCKRVHLANAFSGHSWLTVVQDRAAVASMQIPKHTSRHCCSPRTRGVIKIDPDGLSILQLLLDPMAKFFVNIAVAIVPQLQVAPRDNRTLGELLR